MPDDDNIEKFCELFLKPGTVVFAHPDTAYEMNRVLFQEGVDETYKVQAVEGVAEGKLYVIDPSACSLQTTFPPPSSPP